MSYYFSKILNESFDNVRAKIEEDLGKFGFDISFDLMYALPGQDLDVWQKDLEEAVSLNPESLDIYCYYPLHTKLYLQVMRRKMALPTEAELLQMIETTISFLDQKGYRQETAEDFAKPGKVNIIKAYGYAKVKKSDDYVYLALGPNAMGFIRNYTYRNKFYGMPSARNYLSKSRNEHNLPLFLLERFTNQKQRNLAMFPRAIEMKKERIGEELLDRFAGKITDLTQKGLLTDTNGCLALTDLGRLWIDNISYELMYDHIRMNFGTSIFTFPKNQSMLNK
jgi:oxygen-independent coproporphyrinogen-3 oxidase